jgi:hypothetical protein
MDPDFRFDAACRSGATRQLVFVKLAGKNKFFTGGAKKGACGTPPDINPQRALDIFRFRGARP